MRATIKPKERREVKQAAIKILSDRVYAGFGPALAAESPSQQAKGRAERSFQTAQDRLVKGLRVAGASTLEQANTYLEEKFLL